MEGIAGAFSAVMDQDPESTVRIVLEVPVSVYDALNQKAGSEGQVHEWVQELVIKLSQPNVLLVEVPPPKLDRILEKARKAALAPEEWARGVLTSEQSAGLLKQLKGLYHLTDREFEALKLISLGKSTKEIAGEMKITPNTVKSFLRIIMLKMQVVDRTGINAKLFALSESRH